MGVEYYPALTCKRGHVESWVYEPDQESSAYIPPAIPTRCPECGAPLIHDCPACGERIRGASRGGIMLPDRLDDFCDHCGTPYPWASRKARIYQLENLLDEDDSLDEATRLRVRETLGELAQDKEGDPKTEAARWGNVKKLWPGVATVGQTVLTSILTAEGKRLFGLPP